MYYSIESKATQISDPQVGSHIILHITVHNGTYASKKLVFSSCTTDGNIKVLLQNNFFVK